MHTVCPDVPILTSTHVYRNLIYLLRPLIAATAPAHAALGTLHSSCHADLTPAQLRL